MEKVVVTEGTMGLGVFDRNMVTHCILAQATTQNNLSQKYRPSESRVRPKHRWEKKKSFYNNLPDTYEFTVYSNHDSYTKVNR